MFEMIAERIQ